MGRWENVNLLPEIRTRQAESAPSREGQGREE